MAILINEDKHGSKGSHGDQKHHHHKNKGNTDKLISEKKLIKEK